MFGDEHYMQTTYKDEEDFNDNLKEAFRGEDSSRHIDYGKVDDSSYWEKYVPDLSYDTPT